MSVTKPTDLDLEVIAQRRADYESTVDDVDALIAEVERLRVQLAFADTVCTIYGWTSHTGTEESKALEQAYQDWARHYGSPRPTPLWRAKVKELASRREENRRQALANIRRPRDEAS